MQNNKSKYLSLWNDHLYWFNFILITFSNELFYNLCNSNVWTISFCKMTFTTLLDSYYSIIINTYIILKKKNIIINNNEMLLWYNMFDTKIVCYHYLIIIKWWL